MAASSSNRRLPACASGYELREQIGQGTCAAVYRAWCEEIKDEVAIKVVELEWLQAPLEDIGREIQVMSLSSHPNVVPFSTAFVQAADLWIVMPLLTGGSVLSLMNCAFREGLPEDYARYVLWCVLNALEYFHGNGQIHRDVKAANLMFDSHGNTMLSDYGMMGWMVEGGWDRKQRQTFVGTPCWMAPEVMEQAEGYDYKADIWSLGITAIELAQGRAPYINYAPMKVLFLTLQNPPPTLADEVADRFSPKFKDFVRVCLQKDPRERPSAKQLLKHSLFAGGVAKPDTLAETIARLPPIGSRGGSQRQLFRQLQKVNAPQRSGIYDLSAKGLGWDFGDEKESQKAPGSISDQDVDVNKTPHPSPNTSTPASASSDSAPTLPVDNLVTVDAQLMREGAQLSLEAGALLPPSAASALLPPSAARLSASVPSHNLSSAPNRANSKAPLVSSSLSAPAQRAAVSGGLVSGDAADQMRLMTTQGSSSGISSSVPAKTVGLLKKGRFTVSDVISQDKLDGKIGSFLDNGSSDPIVGTSSAVSDMSHSLLSMPSSSILPSSAAPAAQKPPSERQATSQHPHLPPAAGHIPAMDGTQDEEVRNAPTMPPSPLPSATVLQNLVDRKQRTSGGRPPVVTEIKPPPVRVVSVPSTSSAQSQPGPVVQPKLGPATKQGAVVEGEKSIMSGIAPVVINVEPKQNRPNIDVQRTQNIQQQTTIPIRQVPASQSLGTNSHHAPDRNTGRPNGVRAPQPPAGQVGGGLPPASAVGISKIPSKVPVASSAAPTNMPAAAPISETLRTNGQAPTVSSGHVQGASMTMMPVASASLSQQHGGIQKPAVPMLVPTSAANPSSASATQLGTIPGVQGTASTTSAANSATVVQKKKSRFEVKDVPVSSGKPVVIAPVSLSNSAESLNPAVSSGLPPSGASGTAPTVTKQKSRFEVKDIEQKPRQQAVANGSPAIVGVATSSAGNSVSGSRQGTPTLSPQPEIVTITHPQPAKAAFSLLGELQGTIQNLVQENDSLKREVAMLRGRLQAGMQNAPLAVSGRSISANEALSTASSLAGQKSLNSLSHAQSAGAILTHAPAHNQQGLPPAQTSIPSNSQIVNAAMQQGQSQVQPQLAPQQNLMQVQQGAALPQYVTTAGSVQVRGSQPSAGHTNDLMRVQTTLSQADMVSIPAPAMPSDSIGSDRIVYAEGPPQTVGGQGTQPGQGMYASAMPHQQQHGASASDIGSANLGLAPGSDSHLRFQGAQFQNTSGTGFSGDGNNAVSSRQSLRMQSVGPQTAEGSAQIHSGQTRVIDIQLPSLYQPVSIAATLAAAMSTVDRATGVIQQGGGVEQTQHHHSVAQDGKFRGLQ
eukprot:GFKZ01014509.1.p1 GENE.GFKZ01014509.1~~GFKZ01014509.1.p1  ORF type:complete len:1434 (-),score=190.04 GFKZ01014509.1:1509-5540(-)